MYDIDNYKMALGQVVDFDAPPPKPEDDEDEDSNDIDADDVDENGNKKEPNHLDFLDLENGLIFSGIAFVFIVLACWVCKRRRDEERRNSGT